MCVIITASLAADMGVRAWFSPGDLPECLVCLVQDLGQVAAQDLDVAGEDVGGHLRCRPALRVDDGWCGTGGSAWP